MNQMKRLGIFCFFEKDGIVDQYVEYLICDLKKNLEKLVVVINGDIRNEEKEKIYRYADEIYKRENRGYDGGAYAEYIKRNLQTIELEEWDEIIFCNNSFFGPMIPFASIFEEMGKKEEVDFWGLRFVDKKLFSYLESYFLVFRKRIILSGDLFSFFAGNKFLENASYLEVCSCFERGLFAHLTQRGYQYGAYGVTNEYDVFEGADINLICYNTPIVKKKIVDCMEYQNGQIENIGVYLRTNMQYDFGLINAYLKRKNKTVVIPLEFDRALVEERKKCCKCVTKYDCTKNDLEKFIKENDEIYIYGAGYLAGNIFWAYKYLFSNFKGFIVSEKENKSDNMYFGEYVYDIREIPENSNIIVALNKKNTKEIVEQTEGRHNVFLFWEMERK